MGKTRIDAALVQFIVGERAGPSVPRRHLCVVAHRSMARAHGRRARGTRPAAGRAKVGRNADHCVSLKWVSNKKSSPLLIRAVVKVDSAIGAVAQAVRPRISRVPRAPWLLSRAPSIRPRSTVVLAAFWVRIQRASGFNAWPFELQALSRGAQIGCVCIASVASGGGSGGGAILTIWSLLAASVLLGGPS